MTLGDLYPRLKQLPGYEAIAGREIPDVSRESPSLPAMAADAARSLAAHLADGGRKAPPEVQAERMTTCRACPHLEPTMPACRKCGCGSVLKGGLELKLSWASSRCPDLNPRWGPYDGEKPDAG